VSALTARGEHPWTESVKLVGGSESDKGQGANADNGELPKSGGRAIRSSDFFPTGNAGRPPPIDGAIAATLHPRARRARFVV